jgi:hypothetical protein
MKVSIKTGTEGPAHDPYAYTEYTAKSLKDDRLITLHLGLAEWLDFGSLKVYHESGGLAEQFTKLTGEDPFAAEESYNNPKCSKHPDAEVEGVSGHPGEYFARCSVCKDILETYFNESEII